MTFYSVVEGKIGISVGGKRVVAPIGVSVDVKLLLIICF